MASYTVVVRDIPILGKPEEYLDYFNERRKEYSHLALKEALMHLSDFVQKHPQATLYYDIGLAGTGAIFDEKQPGAYYYDIEINMEKAP